MIRILLADDHNVMRSGLRHLLEDEPDFDVVGEVADGLEAVRLAGELHPDVLITDVVMGDISGIEVARQVAERYRGVKVVVLSMYGEERYVLDALRCGAMAYVLKDASATELAQAVRAAVAGKRFLSSTLSEMAIEGFMGEKADRPTDPYDRLTSREREILHLTVQGCTDIETAERLFISRRTVQVHRANLMQKLGLKNRPELFAYAVQQGIISSKT